MTTDLKFLRWFWFICGAGFVLTIATNLPGCSTTQKTEVNVRAEILKIADSSECGNYFFKDRGYAPKSYLRGMAIMYARQVCDGSEFIKQDKVTSTFKLSWENKTRNHLDALEYYGINGNELNTYAFLIGLGMRESSGRYCLGRDKSADFVKDHEAEAGLFQSSYGSRLFNTDLEKLYKYYQENQGECELSTFSEGVKCSDYNARNWGNGPGVAWQDLVKKCPALATKWAAISIRSYYREFGPIIKKEVEFKTQCRDMLQKVEKVAKLDCGQVL